MCYNRRPKSFVQLGHKMVAIHKQLMGIASLIKEIREGAYL
jgi:hypothetical protein